MASNFRPAGFSSEDDSEDEGFSFAEPIKYHRPSDEVQYVPKVETPVNDMDILRMAAVNGNVHELKSLIEEKKFSVDVIIQGWTPLMFAATNCQYEAMEFLLNKGANPNFHQHSYTVLMSACSSKKQNKDVCLKCVQLLLDFGADVNVRQRNGCTTLMIACREGNEGIVEELIKKKADINAQDVMGWTPLIWSVNHSRPNQMEIIQSLLNNGADVTIRCLKGQTAHEHALNLGLLHISAQIPSSTNQVESSLKSEFSTINRDSWEYLRDNICGSEEENWILWHDVARSLNQLGILFRYGVTFKENKMDLVKFLTLTDDKLESLSVLPLHRKRLLEMIQKLHLKQWKERSIDMRNIKNMQNEYNMVDEIKLIANLARQMTMIKASVIYVGKQECSERKSDFKMEEYVDKIDSALISARCVHEQLNSYISFVTAQLGVKKNPADWIGPNDGTSRKRNYSLVVLAVTVGIIAYFVCKKE